MRVLVDTCVIINALQSRVPFAETAQKLFIYSANKKLRVILLQNQLQISII